MGLTTDRDSKCLTEIDPETGMQFPRRFREKIVVTDTGYSTDCWLWKGSLSPEGYSRAKIDRKTKYMHRVLYELLIGPIPDNLQLDHLCRVRRCTNPNHMEPVTCRVNVLRGVSPVARRAQQTHCKNGHEFTEDNTKRNTRGTRCCRICRRAWNKARGWA